MLNVKTTNMKTITLIIAFLNMFNIFLIAQPEMNWQQCYGGSQAEGFRRLAITENNELVFIGSTYSNDGDVSGIHGESDFWLGIINSNGTLLWQKCLGGSLWDYGNAIDICADGGFIIGGSTKSNDGDITELIGSVDFWIVKTSSNGIIEWQKCFGGTSADDLFAIKQTLDGGYIATGQTYSNDINVSGNHGGIDTWVVKIDSIGEIEWQNCLGGSNDDWGNEISLTNNGYYILNYTDSNDGDVSGNHGNKDYWIVKLDFSGNIVWQKCLGGSDLDQGNSILTTSDGGCIVIGRTYSYDGDISNNTGDSDYWLAKLDSLGNLQWEKCFGFDLTYFRDHGQSIYQTTDQGFLIAGYSASIDYPFHTTCYEDWDFWIVKISSNGIKEWEKCLGGLDKDFAYSILEDNYGNVYVGGNTRSNDGDVSGNHGLVDSWLVKLGDFTNIETKESFQTPPVFPNPTSSTITIKLNNESNRLNKLNIYDSKGRLIKSIKCNYQESVSVDVSEFRKGLYFYRFKNSTKFFGKFIVQ
jgi:hypothetical protein